MTVSCSAAFTGASTITVPSGKFVGVNAVFYQRKNSIKINFLFSHLDFPSLLYSFVTSI